MGAEIDSLEIRIETSASAANRELTALASKLELLVADLGKINVSGIDKISKSLRGATSSATKTGNSSNNLKKFSNAMDVLTGSSKRSGSALKSFSQIAGDFYANTFLLVRGAKKLWQGVESSMDYVETFNYWKVALDKIGAGFGDQFEQYGYDSADAYVASFSGRLKDLTAKMTGFNIGESGDLVSTNGKNLGVDPEQLMNYQAKILGVTNSVGLMGETSIYAAKALSMLSADMSSLTNQDLSTVMTNFQSGLIGQSRAMYKYGIDITNATLQTYAYELGVSKAVTEMTQAEKMQLRLIAILDQSKVAWGDQANTINSVANQYRILKQQIQNLARTLGNLFLPIIKTVLPVVNGLVIAITRLFNVLGFKINGDSWLKDLQDGISGGYGGDGLEDLADSADDATDSLNDAAGAAKKLKTSTLGIDELNIISPQEDSGSGSAGGSAGGGSIDLSGAIGDALLDYESVWEQAFSDSQNKAQQYADTITSVFEDMWDAIEPVRDAISNLWDNGLSKLANFTWTALKDFYDNFLVPIGEWAFGTEDSGLARLVNVINDGLMAIDWETLNTSLKNFWIAIEPYAEQFGEGLIDFFEDLTGIAVDVINNIFGEGGAVQSITDWLNNNDPEKARNWGYAFGEFVVALMALKGVASILKGIANFGIALKTLQEGLSAVFGAKGIFTTIGSKIATIGGKIATLVSKIGTAFSGLGKVLSLVSEGTGISEAFVSVFGTIGTAIAGIGSIISGAVLAVVNFFSMWESGWNVLGEILKDLGIALTAVGAVILGVAAAPAAIVAAVVAAASTIVIVAHDNWDAICDWFSGAAEWFNTNVITPVSGYFKGLWTSVSGFFKSLWSDVSTVWSTVSQWFSDNVIEPTVGFFKGLWTRVKQYFEGLWIIVQAVWIVASTWFDENVTTPIKKLFSTLKKNVSGFFEKLWDSIKEIWSLVSTWFDENVITPVQTAFDTFKTTVKDLFSTLWSGIKEVWKDVSSWFSNNVIDPVKDAWETATVAISGFFDGLWKGIETGVVGAMNAVIGGIESAINWIVGGINKIIGGFNKIVSWAAKVAETDWGGVDEVPTVKLQRLAKGGLANRATLAEIGEAGKEAVLPLENKRTMKMIADSILEGMSANDKESTHQIKFALSMDDFTSQWRSQMQEWWDIDVLPWFSAEKWSETTRVIKDSICGALSDAQGQWKSDISNWWSADVETWFEKDRWERLLVVIPEYFKDAFMGAANGVIEILNKVIKSVESMINQTVSGLNQLIASINMIPGMSIPMLNTVALDGIPEIVKDSFENQNRLAIAEFSPARSYTEDLRKIAQEKIHNSEISYFQNGGSASREGIFQPIIDAQSLAADEAKSASHRQEELLEEIVRAVREGRDITIDGRSLVKAYDARKSRNGFSFT